MEVLIALFILSVTIAFVVLITGMIKVIRDSAYENRAFHIAENKLDDLRKGGYAALPANGAFTDPELANLPQGLASTSVSVWNAKTKQVQTGVSWLTANGSLKYVTLTTLMTQTGGL